MFKRNNLICLISVSFLLSSCSGRIIPGLVSKAGQKAAAFSRSLKSVSTAPSENTTVGNNLSRRQSVGDSLNEDSNISYDSHSIDRSNQRNKNNDVYNSEPSYSSHRITGDYDNETVRGVSVSSSDLNMKSGEEKTVEAKVHFSGGGMDENVRWESSDQSVAKISSDGRIEAVSGGSATISAYSTGNFSKKDSISVEVDSPASDSSGEGN
jgi:uncharacterized protein YjdB